MTQAQIEEISLQQFNYRIWDQLDHQQWPEELDEIKPSKWDLLDANQKGKVVLENLGQIIYHVTLLTNRLKTPRQPLANRLMQGNYLYP